MASRRGETSNSCDMKLPRPDSNIASISSTPWLWCSSAAATTALAKQRTGRRRERKRGGRQRFIISVGVAMIGMGWGREALFLCQLEVINLVCMDRYMYVCMYVCTYISSCLCATKSYGGLARLVTSQCWPKFITLTGNFLVAYDPNRKLKNLTGHFLTSDNINRNMLKNFF